RGLAGSGPVAQQAPVQISDVVAFAARESERRKEQNVRNVFHLELRASTDSPGREQSSASADLYASAMSIYLSPRFFWQSCAGNTVHAAILAPREDHRPPRVSDREAEPSDPESYVAYHIVRMIYVAQRACNCAKIICLNWLS